MKRKTYNYQQYAAYSQRPAVIQKKRRLPLRFFLALVLVVAVVGFGAHAWASHSKKQSAGTVAVTKTKAVVSPPSIRQTQATQPSPAPATASTPCDGNTLSQNVVISIGKQHLWACENSKVAYDVAVVTGMEQYAADLTPTGTYHIYGKQTNISLKGCDNTGCWDDPVSYWMPWLDNQYGQYGFHDATWRSASDFGNIDINAPSSAAEHGSHGCVELPLAAAKWLYDWSEIGTTVTIQS